MDRVESMDQYELLLAETRRNCKNSMVNNSYMFTKAIQRYIDLGRLYYERLEGGIVFYSDEESHYRCYFHVDSSSDVKLGKKIEKKDKLVLSQVLYRKNKTARELAIARKLEESGFALQDIMDYVTVDYLQTLKKVGPYVKHIQRLLDDSHLTCRTLLPSEVKQFVEFQSDIKCIPYYQLAYHSPEEYERAIQEGRVECVVDQEGNLCAAHYFDAENGALGGWYAIKEAYQKAYGIVMMFNYNAARYAEANNIGKEYGWVLRNNTESIKYHKRIGFIWQDRVMEEWILS